jgi:hypothetical protein
LAQRLAQAAADILWQRRRELAEAKLRLLAAMCLAVACGPVDGSRAGQQMEAAVEALREDCGLKGDVWDSCRVVLNHVVAGRPAVLLVIFGPSLAGSRGTARLADTVATAAKKKKASAQLVEQLFEYWLAKGKRCVKAVQGMAHAADAPRAPAAAAPTRVPARRAARAPAVPPSAASDDGAAAGPAPSKRQRRGGSSSQPAEHPAAPAPSAAVPGGPSPRSPDISPGVAAAPDAAPAPPSPLRPRLSRDGSTSPVELVTGTRVFFTRPECSTLEYGTVTGEPGGPGQLHVPVLLDISRERAKWLGEGPAVTHIDLSVTELYAEEAEPRRRPHRPWVPLKFFQQLAV